MDEKEKLVKLKEDFEIMIDQLTPLLDSDFTGLTNIVKSDIDRYRTWIKIIDS